MANEITKFFIGRMKHETKYFNFTDRTNIFMDSKIFLTSKRLLQNDENKSHQLVGGIDSFKNIFNDSIKHGIPSFWDGNRSYLCTENNYRKLLDERRNNEVKFDKMEGNLKGQDVIDLLAEDFEMIDNLKLIFINLSQPSYEKYTNLHEIVRTLNNQK
jgi:hypothetical protein